MKKSAHFLGLLAMVLAAPLARADFQISVNGVNCTPIVSGGPNGSLTCPSVTVGAVTITNLSVTGLQSAGFSQQLGSTLLVTNTSGSAVTLTIDIADSNFSSPVTPPAISDHSGATLDVTTGANSFTLTSCVDQSNGLVPPGSTFCSSPAPGEAGPNPTLNQTGPGTTSNESAGTITSLHASFSLTQQLVIVAGADSDFNVTSSQVLTPVPEPTSVMLLGGVLLGVTSLVRKKIGKRS